MATSNQAQILDGAVILRYPASAAVVSGTIVNHDGANGTVSTATSGDGYGIACNDAAIGQDVYVCVFGPAKLKFDGTVTAGASIVATTAGAGLAAGAAAKSRIVCTPDSKAGASYVSGDVGYVLIGIPYTTPA